MEHPTRRRFSPECKEQSVARLSEPGAARHAAAAELAQLRRDNKRLKEEVEVLRKASAFFAQRTS